MSAGYPPISGRISQCCTCHGCSHTFGGGCLGVKYGGGINQSSPIDIVALRLAVKNLNKTLEIVIETFGPLSDSGMIGGWSIESPVERVK